MANNEILKTSGQESTPLLGSDPLAIVAQNIGLYAETLRLLGVDEEGIQKLCGEILSNHCQDREGLPVRKGEAQWTATAEVLRSIPSVKNGIESSRQTTLGQFLERPGANGDFEVVLEPGNPVYINEVKLDFL